MQLRDEPTCGAPAVDARAHKVAALVPVLVGGVPVGVPVDFQKAHGVAAGAWLLGKGGAVVELFV